MDSRFSLLTEATCLLKVKLRRGERASSRDEPSRQREASKNSARYSENRPVLPHVRYSENRPILPRRSILERVGLLHPRTSNGSEQTSKEKRTQKLTLVLFSGYNVQAVSAGFRKNFEGLLPEQRALLDVVFVASDFSGRNSTTGDAEAEALRRMERDIISRAEGYPSAERPSLLPPGTRCVWRHSGLDMVRRAFGIRALTETTQVASLFLVDSATETAYPLETYLPQGRPLCSAEPGSAPECGCLRASREAGFALQVRENKGCVLDEVHKRKVLGGGRRLSTFPGRFNESIDTFLRPYLREAVAGMYVDEQELRDRLGTVRQYAGMVIAGMAGKGQDSLQAKRALEVLAHCCSLEGVLRDALADCDRDGPCATCARGSGRRVFTTVGDTVADPIQCDSALLSGCREHPSVCNRTADALVSPAGVAVCAGQPIGKVPISRPARLRRSSSSGRFLAASATVAVDTKPPPDAESAPAESAT